MKKSFKSVMLSIVIAVLMVLEPVLGTPVNAEVKAVSTASVSHVSDSQIDSAVKNIVKWYKNGKDKLMNSDFLQYAGSTAGDWMPLGAARYGIQDDYDAYLKAVSKYITDCYATDEKLSDCKATEWERIALAVGAAGGDPTHIGKDKDGKPVNLIADGTYNSVNDYDDQGINAYIFGLIALDSKKYAIPAGARYTRDSIIEEILKSQLKNGGFNLWCDGDGDADTDISAMAVQALAPYYNDTKTYTYDLDGVKTTKTIKQVVNEALQSIRCNQKDNGDMYSWGSCNSEGTDQVIVALCSLGIDPEKDQRFITKTGKTLLDGLMRYVQADGGIAHTIDTGSNAMATDQALYTFAAMKRQRSGMSSLYDYTDISDHNVSAAVPVINTQPQNATTDEGSSIKLKVSASVSDKGILSYQWYKDNKAISGANSSEYDLKDILQDGSGSYYAVITNTLNGTTARAVSNKITVTINKPKPQSDPQSSNNTGNTGSSTSAGKQTNNTGSSTPADKQTNNTGSNTTADNQTNNAKGNTASNNLVNSAQKNTSSKGKLVKTGSPVDSTRLIILGLVLVGCGTLILVKKSKGTKLN